MNNLTACKTIQCKTQSETIDELTLRDYLLFIFSLSQSFTIIVSISHSLFLLQSLFFKVSHSNHSHPSLYHLQNFRNLSVCLSLPQSLSLTHRVSQSLTLKTCHSQSLSLFFSFTDISESLLFSLILVLSFLLCNCFLFFKVFPFLSFFLSQQFSLFYFRSSLSEFVSPSKCLCLSLPFILSPQLSLLQSLTLTVTLCMCVFFSLSHTHTF